MKRRTPAPVAEPLDTARLLSSLTACLPGRAPPSALSALASFEALGGDVGAVDLDELRAFVRGHFDALVALCGHRQPAVRHAALWALGGAEDPRAAAVLVASLLSPKDFFDHDYAYMAAAQLRARGVEWFTRIALDGTASERAAALSCIGLARSPDVALAALTQIAAAHGHSAALYSALYNTHDPRALTLALAGLWHDSAKVRCEAVGVVHECVRMARDEGAKLSVSDDVIARAVERLFIDPGVWVSEGDPWASTFAWALGVLAHTDPATAERVARLGTSSPVLEARTVECFAQLRALPFTDAIERDVTPHLTAKSRAFRALAAMVLANSPREATRHGALELLHARVLDEGAIDPSWHDVVDVLGEDDASVDRWLREAKRDRAKPKSKVRDRVAQALEHLAFERESDGDRWVDSVLARCDARLADALRKRLGR
jgi:hypothetical protein